MHSNSPPQPTYFFPRRYFKYLTRNKLYTFIAVACTVIALYICFYQLGSGFFENWDEAWYADVTRNMLRTGNLIVLFWNGNVFLDKTPLNFWFSSIFALIFGLNEFSIRLTSALSGFAVIIIVTLYALRKWGSVPAIAAFSAVALNNIYIWRTRTGNLDALASLLVLLIFFTMLSKKPKRLIILGVLFGLTYLQKATLVGYPFVLFILHEVLYEWKHIRRNLKFYLIMILIFASIVGGWLALGSLQHGKYFAEYYLFKADQGVSHISLDKFNTDYLWHVYYSLQRRIFFLFALGIIFLGINARKKENVMLVLFSLALIAQLSFTERNNNWYLVPSMPFWGLAVGVGTWGIISTLRRLFAHTWGRSLISLAVCIPILYVSYKTFTVNIHAIINTRANVSEVYSARKIKELSKPEDAIMRLDWSYPATNFYSDRITYYYVTVDNGLYETIQEKKTRWVVGKTSQVDAFLSDYKEKPKRVISLDDEKIVEIDAR